MMEYNFAIKIEKPYFIFKGMQFQISVLIKKVILKTALWLGICSVHKMHCICVKVTFSALIMLKFSVLLRHSDFFFYLLLVKFFI